MPITMSSSALTTRLSGATFPNLSAVRNFLTQHMPDRQMRWRERGPLVKGTCKILECASAQLCPCKVVIKKTQELWRVDLPRSSLRHGILCNSLPHGDARNFACDPVVHELFLRTNVQQIDLIRHMQRAHQLTVNPMWVTRLKDLVLQEMDKMRQRSARAVIPVLMRMTAANPTARALVVARKGGEEVTVKFGVPGKPPPSLGELNASLQGAQLERTLVVLPWARRVIELKLGPPVLAMDGTFLTDGANLGVLAARAFGTIIPVAVQWQRAESADSMYAMLCAARKQLPELFNAEDASLIIDRGRAVIAAAERFVREHNPNVQILYCKEHILRNLLANFPAFRSLDTGERDAIRKNVVYATSELRFNAALNALDAKYAKLSGKRAARVAVGGTVASAGAESAAGQRGGSLPSASTSSGARGGGAQAGASSTAQRAPSGAQDGGAQAGAQTSASQRGGARAGAKTRASQRSGTQAGAQASAPQGGGAKLGVRTGARAGALQRGGANLGGQAGASQRGARRRRGHGGGDAEAESSSGESDGVAVELSSRSGRTASDASDDETTSGVPDGAEWTGGHLIGEGFYAADEEAYVSNDQGTQRAAFGDASVEPILDDEEAHRAALKVGRPGVWRKPSDYVRAIPGARFLVFMLRHTDYGINTSNPAEGVNGYLKRGDMRTGDIASNLITLLQTVPRLFWEKFLSLEQLDRKGEWVVPWWPSAFLGGREKHPGEFVAEYAAIQKHGAGARVQRSGSLRYHDVSWVKRPPAGSTAHWSVTWALAASGEHHVMCNGGCMCPQREHRPCVHLMRAVGHLSGEEQRVIASSATAKYYQVGYLLAQWRVADNFAVNVPNLEDVCDGPELRPIVTPRRVKVQWDAHNGGRPEQADETQEALDFEEMDRLIAATVDSDRILSIGEIRKKCGKCGEKGHNVRTCPRLQGGAAELPAGVSAQDVAVKLAEAARAARAQMEAAELAQRQASALLRQLKRLKGEG